MRFALGGGESGDHRETPDPGFLTRARHARGNDARQDADPRGPECEPPAPRIVGLFPDHPSINFAVTDGARLSGTRSS